MHETDACGTDSEIIRRVLAGERDEYERLVERYEGRVAQIVSKRVPPADVPDVAQDVFVRAYLSLGGYDGRGEFGGWLAKIAVRACVDFWRERYRRREQPVSELGEDQERYLDQVISERSSRASDEEAAAAEARALLDWALARLSAEDRAVLELVHLEGRPVKEAAALLGWSVVNVKVRAFRSRKKLRAILDGLIAEKEAHHESA